MKVLFVDPMMVGSHAIYATSLLSNLGGDCDVEILGNSLYGGADVPSNMTYNKTFAYTKKNGLSKLLSYLQSLKEVYCKVKNERPDIIHIQWLKLHSLESYFYLWLRRRYKSKILFTAHNILPHDTGDKYYKAYKRFYNGIDATIVHDRNTKQELVKMFCVDEDKVHVIGHGIVCFKTDKNMEAAEEKDFIVKHGIKSDILVFASMGVQSRYKGTDVLIESWLECKELHDNPKCALVIAGNCRELNLHKVREASNIYIEDGFLSDERFNGIMHRTDVLVLPYRMISQSGVTMQAIDYKIPILVTDVGGLADPLSIANIGWKIDSCRKDLLQEKLIALVRNAEKVRALKNDNEIEWIKVQRAYSWNEIGKQTFSLYNSILNKKYCKQ